MSPSPGDLCFRPAPSIADDHKYTDLYGALFEPIRRTVRNVTEVGIASGQSIAMWHDYFPQAKIYGLDIHIRPRAAKALENATRVRLHTASSQKRKSVESLKWSLGSMDIIIDDGEHTPRANERTLLALWPYLRVGGYFCIEDMATGARNSGFYHDVDKLYAADSSRIGMHPLAHNESWRTPEAQRIFDENDSFFVDTAVGHRAYKEYYQKISRAYGPIAARRRVYDHVNHLSHVLVIRRRASPRRRKVAIHSGTVAMRTYGPRSQAQTARRRRS